MIYFTRNQMASNMQLSLQWYLTISHYSVAVLSNPCLLLQAPQHGYVITFVG